MFVWRVSSELPNVLQANLAWWYIITSWTVMQEHWFSIFKVTVTVSAHIIKIWLFLKYWTAEPDQMQTKWGYTLTTTLWLRVSLSKMGGWGWEVAVICRGRRQTLLVFETVHFSTISSDKGRFVWRHNTFLDQAMVFVNGIVQALAFRFKKKKKLK